MILTVILTIVCLLIIKSTCGELRSVHIVATLLIMFIPNVFVGILLGIFTYIIAARFSILDEVIW